MRSTVNIFTRKPVFSSIIKSIRYIAFGLLLLLLSGCNLEEYLLFQPKGEIAEQQSNLIVLSFLIMMIVVVPVIFMTIWFPIRYRKNRKDTEKAKYTPNWEHSNKVEFWVWSIPCAIIVWLGIITYQTSFSLDPRKPIESENPTMRVHVVALDWKWLFIYPEEGIAAVNELTIPVNTPVEFLITSDTVMNSFSIPSLGSMIYAMAGMENQLHLIGEELGTYRGYSANYSGFGFSGMKFDTHVVEKTNFDQWINKVKESTDTLTPARFNELAKKTKDHPIEYFGSASPLTFNYLVEKYTGQQGQKTESYSNPFITPKVADKAGAQH